MQSEFSFLVWNTNRKSLYREISDLVDENGIDFVILIENTADPTQLVANLEIQTGRRFYYSKNRLNFKNGHIYSVVPDFHIRDLLEHPRYTIKEVTLPNQLINIAIVHLPSKNNWGDSRDHDALCSELGRDIIFCEADNKNNKTLVVGDFNMNPFENGMINANGLHSVMDKSIALREKRKIYEREYRFFYNPMWSFYGEEGKSRLNGTNYYNSSKFVNFFWNMYDQVLIRPELIPNFDDRDLQIISKIKQHNLTFLHNGENRIDTFVSDHLPITFKLKF